MMNGNICICVKNGISNYENMKWEYVTSMQWEMVYITRICMNMEWNMMWAYNDCNWGE